jgi:hypothetical protein
VAAPSDTHPVIARMMLDAFRKMSPAEKLRRVEALNEAVLQLAAARISKEHPGIDAHELRLRVAALWLGEETMRRVFAWPSAP